MTSYSLVDTLHIDHGHFHQCVVDLTILYVYGLWEVYQHENIW